MIAMASEKVIRQKALTDIFIGFDSVDPIDFPRITEKCKGNEIFSPSSERRIQLTLANSSALSLKRFIRILLDKFLEFHKIK